MFAPSSRSSPSGAVQDRMLGRVLGDRYRVLSRLGEGGMGTVYLCEHVVLGRRFAVKVLKAELVADSELADRFRNEAIAASTIGQENVVEVLDFGADEDGALYYVMEALDGRSLATVIREEGPLPVARALELVEQMARALAAAHARGVVHRDVKPDNVFVVRRGDGSEQVKVIDFGISQVPTHGASARLTRAGAIIGTPEYMAPEQAVGEPIDRRADVYAAGVLLFEMLTGELPIEAPTPMATIVAHQTRTPDPPSRRVPGIPAGVDALVLRALAKRPEDRIGSMEALAAEAARLRAALPGSPAGGVDRPSRPRGEPTEGVAAVLRPSRPRGETVALPAGLGEGGASRRRVRLAVAGTAVLAAALAGAVLWLAREDVAAPAPATPAATSAPTSAATTTATPSATPTSAATPSATPTSTATSTAAATPGAPALADEPPAPAPAPPVLVDEAAVRPAAPTVDPPRPPASAARRAKPRPASRGAAASDLKDPYEGPGALKDPFK